MDWAARQSPPRGTDKLVLWALADAHNVAKRCAYPSVAAIAAFTTMERKRVMASLARLEKVGLIIDTGQRMGQTRQIKVWALPIERVSKRDP